MHITALADLPIELWTLLPKCGAWLQKTNAWRDQVELLNRQPLIATILPLKLCYFTILQPLSKWLPTETESVSGTDHFLCMWKIGSVTCLPISYHTASRRG